MFIEKFNVLLFNRDVLSKQQHYEWGLRALKTILRGCGSLLQKEKKSEAKSEELFDNFMVYF